MVKTGDEMFIMVRKASEWSNEKDYDTPTIEYAGATIDDARRHLRDALVDFLFDDGKHSLEDYEAAAAGFIVGEKRIKSEFEDLDWDQLAPGYGHERRIGRMNGRYIYADETSAGAWKFSCYHTGRLLFTLVLQKVYIEA